MRADKPEFLLWCWGDVARGSASPHHHTHTLHRGGESDLTSAFVAEPGHAWSCLQTPSSELFPLNDSRIQSQQEILYKQ